jgi:CHASE3 domain sensor protein
MLIIWKSVHEVEAKEINNKVTEIQTTLSRLMWIVITGVAIAVLGLVLK